MGEASPEAPFLREFFAALNERGVRYAVLRNSETLPDSLGGSDLDLFADGQDEAERVLAVANEVSQRHNGGFTVRYTVEATITCLGGRHDDGTWWGLHVDIFPGLMYFGIPYMDSAAAFEERVLERGVFYRLGNLSDIASFVKEIMPNRRTKKDYYPRARQAYAANPQRAKDAMLGCFGLKGWGILENLLSHSCSDADIHRDSRRLVRALWWRQIGGFHWASLAKAKFVNVVRRYGRLFRYPGYCVAFLGTDGSGKSTLIENVSPFLLQMMHHPVEYRHLRPGLLPSLARLAGRPPMDGPVTNPHGGKTAGCISSLVRFFYYYVDYTLGYYAKIFPCLVKRPTFVVCDRYYYEYMIDPKRCAVRLPPGFARFFSWFIPRPDLILCLGGDPEKIYARKPETSLEEVRRQVAALRKFCDGNPRAVWIDTTTTLESSVDAALSAILARMRARTRDMESRRNSD